MHVSLGIGLQIVNIMENMCVKLDGEVKGDSIVYCERMEGKMKRKQDVSSWHDCMMGHSVSKQPNFRKLVRVTS